jgi:hypothetical protein
MSNRFYQSKSKSDDFINLKCCFNPYLGFLIFLGLTLCTYSNADTSRYTRLPSHFNVMKILGHFADNTPVLSDAVDSYPAALPPRLYRDGYGRNRTMFCVMPKYV